MDKINPVIFIIAIWLIALLGIILFFFFRLKKGNDKELKLVVLFLKELRGRTNNPNLDWELINQLPLKTIKLYYTEIYNYSLYCVAGFNAFTLGQYLLNCSKEIKDEEKWKYFSSILEKALLYQTNEKLVKLFFEDLVEEIKNMSFSTEKINIPLVEPRETFRNWFLNILTKEENYKEKGRKVIFDIMDEIRSFLVRGTFTVKKEEYLSGWADRIVCFKKNRMK